MTLKECYQVLGLSQSASLEEIKHAYRTKAFELHPDLNPNLKDEGLQFQKLNEGYVILTKLISVREARDKKAAKPEPKTSPEAKSPPKPEAPEPPKAEAPKPEAKKAEPKVERAEFKTEARSETKFEPEAPKFDTKTSATKAETHGYKSEPRSKPNSAEASAQAGSTQNAQAGSTQNAQAGSTQNAQTASSKETIDEASKDNFYTEQGEVLHDILSDPFARRVFEDIYSEIRKKTPPKAAQVPPSELKSPPKPIKREYVVPEKPKGQSIFDQRFKLDFSKGVGGALKDWLRSQIDEEQVFELPARKLIPGSRIRLQIRHGLSGDLTTIDVTLPPNFNSDKPIRLKGMGKKLGSWQGDLYLRFSPKS